MTSSKQSNATDAVEGKLGSRKPARKQADAISPRSSSNVLLVYVGRQVFAARQRLGLTQEQLAEKARCGPATVFLVENARRIDGVGACCCAWRRRE